MTGEWQGAARAYSCRTLDKGDLPHLLNGFSKDKPFVKFPRPVELAKRGADLARERLG